MPVFIQPSFARGEISPSLYGRVDTTVYGIGLRTARNVVVESGGGASNRAGTTHTGPTKYHDEDPRIIPFQFNTSDKYFLEFGDLYMRVIRNSAYVLETSVSITGATAANPVVITSVGHPFTDGQEVSIFGVLGMIELNSRRYLVSNSTANTFELQDQITGVNVDGSLFTAYTSGGSVAAVYELETPYAGADTLNIKYQQTANTMTLTHQDYETQELTRTGHTVWTIGVPEFVPALPFPADVAITVNSAGSTRYRYQVTAIVDVPFEESLPGVAASLTSVITGVTQANPAVVTSASHPFSNGDEVFIDGVVGMTELNGRYFTVANKAASTFELQGEDSTLHTAYTSGGTVTKSKRVTAITAANPAVVTSQAHGMSDGDEVALAGIGGMTELNNRRFYIANSTANTFELEGEDSSAYTAYTSGGTASPTFAITLLAHATVIDNTISWTAVSGADKYTVYREKNGLWSYIGETQLTSFEDDNLAPDTSITPPAFRNPFFGAGNYAGAVGYYEQRRVLAGSIDGPDTSYYSKTGAHTNFTYSSPQQADDSITATLNSGEVNEIRHLVPGNDLVIMTSGSEWRVNSGGDVGFSADTLRQKPQSSWGCSHIRPAVVGDEILFITENNSQLRSLGFSLEKDKYTGVDVGVISDHLLEGRTVVDAAFSNSPAPRQYLILDDGTALTVTYNQSQDMIAWTRWDTLGKFTRVAVLRNEASPTEDSVAFVVKRTLNGNTVRNIELSHSRLFDAVQDCYFVDCGLSLDSPVAITGITAANPVVVTATAHGFSDGDEVDLSDIEFTPQFDATFNETQPDQLNGRRYTVANKTANTFELSGVDGSANVAYVEGGYVRKAVDTLYGLFHLAGEEVVILSDGNVVSGTTVSSVGSITLPRKASRVHVGLRYISDIETLDIESGKGTVQDRKVKATKVTLRLKKTRGLFVGPSSSKLREMKFRENEAMSNPTDLRTGDKTITLEPTWGSNGRIFIRQPYPLPMTILAAIPDTAIGGGK